MTTLNLQVKHVQCQRSGEPLFAPISLHLRPGELAVVAGPNGSGKTTLMEAIAGLGLLAEGSIQFNDADVDEQWLYHSHYLGHKLGNKGNLTCEENLRFVCHINQIQATNQEIEQVLDQVGLSGYDYHFASDLSAGQKKRLALGRLLLLKKTYWLLDEPFVNLDQAGCEWLYQTIKYHIDHDGAVLLTAHDQKKIHQLADHHVTLCEPEEAIS
ncbi:heme ABC exporter ATP-binding protein CcmA [Marinicella sp. S1101]|uniref:heme ABC exporter ATP-binding protein CcmA n=1 Tax=Marinicella marina TaxID=2996016 RepID=UPI002260B243|nr:heme ABC exporter ATP-binding protein CcmA [Marinicella marina]MCX7554517.1 heme ABC exporter ATP-binding protein CcmA [Marinicella marina]MDJ1140668.1 heme ABC exporter ATP-binding protein CcmA [Marinicella marina]